MDVLAYILILIGFLALLHAYVVYPALMRILAKGRMPYHSNSKNDRPRVWILMSAFNEERIIEKKLESFDKLTYPESKLELWIGSDASSDRTDEIIKDFPNSQIRFFRYEDRAGKANVLNRLKAELKSNPNYDESRDIMVMTDANVLFSEDLIENLVAPFQDDSIGQVGAVIKNYGEDRRGISYQEKFYIGSENQLKINEGKAWATMMGAFGACYAIRAKLIPALRTNFLMEDFYISMNVFDKGYKAVMAEDAICFEDLPSEVSEEFKRKTRISAGNFQNLSVYYHLLWPPGRLSFSFLSHKVLRWLGPIWLSFILAGLILGYSIHGFWLPVLMIYLLLLLSPLLDRIARKMGLHSVLLRYPAYFVEMNLALANGFIKYIKGVRTNAWQPTKRND